MNIPPVDFLADVFRQLPVLVIHTTTDGIVLHCNPEACRVTGYEAGEMMGRNVWALLFPGKLFAQVPKFISLLEPGALLKDVPMSIRTKGGKERVIAFTRHWHGGLADGTARTFICVGIDLTDRLMDAEREKLPPASIDETEGGAFMAFGPNIGNAGAIDGEFVAPIAITPKLPKAGDPSLGPGAIEQAREALAKVETQMACVMAALESGETQTLAIVRGALGTSIALRGSFGFLASGEWVHAEVRAPSMGVIRARLDEILALHPLQKK